MSERLDSKSLLKFQCSCMGVSNEVRKEQRFSDCAAVEPIIRLPCC